MKKAKAVRWVGAQTAGSAREGRKRGWTLSWGTVGGRSLGVPRAGHAHVLDFRSARDNKGPGVRAALSVQTGTLCFPWQPQMSGRSTCSGLPRREPVRSKGGRQSGSWGRRWP